MTHIDYRDPVQVKRAYKFRACPTRPQEGRAARLHEVMLEHLAAARAAAS